MKENSQLSSCLSFESFVLDVTRFRCCNRFWQYFAFSGAQVDRRAWAAIRDLEMTGNPPPLGVATRAETIPQPTPAQIPVDRCRTTIYWIYDAYHSPFFLAARESVQAFAWMWCRKLMVVAAIT